MMMIRIAVTLVGIVTDASDVHERKAPASCNRVRVSFSICNDG